VAESSAARPDASTIRCGQLDTVYTHCNVGMGRSPSVTIAYLVQKQGWNLDDAIEHVTCCRSCSPNIDALVASQ
jgi:protein-tyrosine phosphatase